MAKGANKAKPTRLRPSRRVIVSDGFIVEHLRNFNPAWAITAQVSDGHGGMVAEARPAPMFYYGAAVVGAAIVLACGYFLKKKSERVA